MRCVFVQAQNYMKTSAGHHHVKFIIIIITDIFKVA